MIFIGNGALLKNAITHSRTIGLTIDCVYTTTTELSAFFRKFSIEHRVVKNVNEEAREIELRSTDKLVLSINNSRLLNNKLLSLTGFRFYNIHNGILPNYRGLPQLCIINAILKGEKEYGASLHKIDSGIDTGQCYAIKKTALTSSDTFESVMTKGLTCCMDVFKENIEAILTDSLTPMLLDHTQSQLFTRNDIDAVLCSSNHPNYTRAVKLGVYSLWFKYLYQRIKNQATV